MAEREDPKKSEPATTDDPYEWRSAMIVLGLIGAGVWVWVGVQIEDINSFGISTTYAMLLAAFIWLLSEPRKDQNDTADQEIVHGQRVKGILGVLIMTVVFSISLVAFDNVRGEKENDKKPGMTTNTKQKGNTDQLIECR